MMKIYAVIEKEKDATATSRPTSRGNLLCEVCVDKWKKYIDRQEEIVRAGVYVCAKCKENVTV